MASKLTRAKPNPSLGLKSRAAPIIQRVPLPLVEVEGESHILCYVNSAFCRLLGQSQEELIGKPFAEIVRAGSRCLAILDQVYQTGKAAVHAEQDPSEKNRARWLYAMWPSLDANQRPVGVVIQLAKDRELLANATAINEALLIAGLRQHELREAAEDLNAQLQKEVFERQQAEGRVRISELRFRRIFEAAPDGILILDAVSRRITDVNSFMTNLLGYPREHFIGKELWELGLLKDEQASREAFEELEANGSIRYEDLPLQTSAGERREVEFVSNLYDEAGQRVIQCNIRDISERKRAEDALRESAQRFRFMAESMPQKIFTATPEGKVDYTNRLWSEFTGLGFSDLRDWRWTQLIDPDQAEGTVLRWKNSIETDQFFQSEFRFRRYDGVYRWHLMRVRAMHDAAGRVMMWVGSITDIDDQKRAEENLERKVQERTARLLETVGDLQAFSYSIAHDMRAPLRAMQSFAMLLEEECGEDVGPVGKDYIQRIITSSNRMDRLIQDVLNYSRVVLGGAKLEPVDLQTLVRGILDSYPLMGPPDSEILVEGKLPTVLGNEAALTQCVSNLLANAVKFVTPGTLPRVRVFAETRGDRVRLFVQDNGIGIAKEWQEKIFNIFQQLTPGSEGTGIGLAIVRKAAKRMGGEVGLTSEPGKGSTFWLDLALAPGQIDPGSQSSAGSG